MKDRDWRKSPSHPRYWVSKNGQIIGPRGREMKWQYNRQNGYYWVKIQIRPGYAKPVNVHFLVCEAFHGPRPENAVAMHIDENKAHNSARNLRWGTRSENHMSSWSIGQMKQYRGKDNPRSRAISKATKGVPKRHV